MSENLYHPKDSAVNSLPLYSISHTRLSNDLVNPMNFRPSVNEFKILLEDGNGVELFKRFLDKERAAHYLDFWFACQGFKTAENEKVYQLIKVIYRAYVRSESQCAVALKPNTKKNIVDKLSNKQCLDKSIFDNAQLEIRDILISDFYQRFIKSDSFKLYQQSSLHSDHSKSSENTESLKEHEPSYVECCAVNSAMQPIKCKRDKSDPTSKSNRGKSGACGGSSKDRRSLAESDPVVFVQQVSSKLQKFKITQQCARSPDTNNRRQADICEVLEDDAESILDNHCSYLMAKDMHKCENLVITSSKHDADLRSVLSHDSGVATTFDPSQINSRIPPLSAVTATGAAAAYFNASYITQNYYQASPPPQQYKHHHSHDHHHFRSRRRNKSEDQSVCSLEERTSNQVPCVGRKGKSQASDASSIFDSGVSSTYEQISHPWLVPSDRVSHWVNTNPGMVTTPVELMSHMKRSISAVETTGYKINDVVGTTGEVWIDQCCMDPSQDKHRVKSAQKKGSDTMVIVGYYFCGDPVPYRTQVACTDSGFTLGQFKQLLPRRAPYRYFFKRPCDEFDGNGAVQEEYTRDEQVLPFWEGKIVAKVEKADPL